MVQIQRPHCRSNNVFKTMMGKAKQAAASFGGGFAEGLVKAVADNLIMDGAGRLVPKFGKSLAALAPVEYHNGMYWGSGFMIHQCCAPATIGAYDTDNNSFHILIRKDGKDYRWAEPAISL